MESVLVRRSWIAIKREKKDLKMYNVSNTIQLYSGDSANYMFLGQWWLSIVRSAIPGGQVIPCMQLEEGVRVWRWQCHLCSVEQAYHKHWLFRGDLEMWSLVRQLFPSSKFIFLKEGGLGSKWILIKRQPSVLEIFHAPGNWHFMRTEIMQYGTFCGKS